jgi:hypothetical protein
MMRLSRYAKTLTNEDSLESSKERALNGLILEMFSFADTFAGTGLVTLFRDAVGAAALPEKIAEGD